MHGRENISALYFTVTNDTGLNHTLLHGTPSNGNMIAMASHSEAPHWTLQETTKLHSALLHVTKPSGTSSNFGWIMAWSFAKAQDLIHYSTGVDYALLDLTLRY